MREIKFRAWDNERKIMRFGDEDGMSGLFVEFDGAVSSIDFDCPDGGIGSSDVELMQFTGLKDKNGKEIFEGDIINIYAKDFSHKFQENIDDIFKAHRLCGESKTHWEIIGNVHQDSNLLK